MVIGQEPGPLRAFAQRTAARRGRHVATVAVARKLAVLAWTLPTRGEGYAFACPCAARSAASKADRRRTPRKPGPREEISDSRPYRVTPGASPYPNQPPV